MTAMPDELELKAIVRDPGGREVEVFDLAGATVRTERYPLMDPLVEVEGEPAAIERAIAASGIPRSEFTADSLSELVRRFELRNGAPALLARP
jgi:hypothetical protein